MKYTALHLQALLLRDDLRVEVTGELVDRFFAANGKIGGGPAKLKEGSILRRYAFEVALSTEDFAELVRSDCDWDINKTLTVEQIKKYAQDPEYTLILESYTQSSHGWNDFKPSIVLPDEDDPNTMTMEGNCEYSRYTEKGLMKLVEVSNPVWKLFKQVDLI